MQANHPQETQREVAVSHESDRAACPHCKSARVHVLSSIRPLRYMRCMECNRPFKMTVTYHIQSLSAFVK